MRWLPPGKNLETAKIMMGGRGWEAMTESLVSDPVTWVSACPHMEVDNITDSRVSGMVMVADGTVTGEALELDRGMAAIMVGAEC